MDIQGKTIMVLGGWGLVGTAACRMLLDEKPKRLVVTSLFEAEAKEARELFLAEAGGQVEVDCAWGNIFVRDVLRDTPREEILRRRDYRAMVYDDTMDELNSDVLGRSALYQLITAHRPHIIVDCINTATGISYQDVYDSFRRVRKSLADQEDLQDETEKLLCTLYIPQLIRHVQIAYEAMRRASTQVYVKIGTSGTGGMGLNIPYTHSEEKPSRVLLSKSAIAGAHSMLLFLMGRTPDAPITKEIKPAAAIAWKKIDHGEIRRRGRAIELFDCDPSVGSELRGDFVIRGAELDSLPGVTPFPNEQEQQTLRSVFVDTGENGIFSSGEFAAITAAGQMEFVTPEEIARNVVYEIKGGNTGCDIINALDNASMGPTYRAGFLRGTVVERMAQLEHEHGVQSVAFENLGPPRLSKLLFEAHLLKLVYGKPDAVIAADASEIEAAVWQRVCESPGLRAEIISVGIPILTPDGRRLLRGPEVKIPAHRGEDRVSVNPDRIDRWAHNGWVDLRVENWERWRSRFSQIRDSSASGVGEDDTSSGFFMERRFDPRDDDIQIGSIAAWIFTEEERGERMKG